MTDIELRIVKLLAEGLKNIDLPKILQSEGFEACSLSTIEKSLKKIRATYKAKTNFHLALILTKKGII